MSNIQHTNFSYTAVWHTVAVCALALAVLITVSPQIALLGSGLRTTLPALAVAWVAISRLDPTAFTRSFLRFSSFFLFSFLFLLQAWARFLYVENHYIRHNLFHRHFFGPMVLIALILSIGALTELGKKTLLRFRMTVLFGWCTSLALGLPMLISDPGIARSTMGNNDLAAISRSIYPLYGIGSYSTYTTLALCMLPMLQIAQSVQQPFFRYFSFILLALAGASVAFSTFTMAAFFFTISTGVAAVLWTLRGKSILSVMARLYALFFIAAAVLSYGSFNNVYKFEQLDFVLSKTERLYQGITESGLTQGDETGRGRMFIEAMEAVITEPFFGYIPGVTKNNTGGHSSFADSLVLFGFFGTLFWLLGLWNIIKDGYQLKAGQPAKSSNCVDRRKLFIAGLLPNSETSEP